MRDQDEDNHDRPWIEEVRICRADELDVLRAFRASIQLEDDDSDIPVTIGSINGLVGRLGGSTSLWEAADSISADVEPLGRAADEIQGWLYADEGVIVDAVVMIELLLLEPQHRGRRQAGGIVDQALDLLQFDPATTLVVLVPEPQKESGGFMPEGPERDAALKRLRLAYEKQGFSQWRDTTVWWNIQLESFDPDH